MASYDFIVVGGGSAGCAAANALVTRYNAKVLLLEAGSDKRSVFAKIPAGTVKMWSGKTDYIGRFFSEPEPGLNGRRVPLEHGTVMGGGSTVNMMAYLRGCKRDYDQWSEAVEGGWGWDDLLPYFRRQEGNQRLDNLLHGGDGPLKVSDPAFWSPTSHAFVKAMQRAGAEFRPDLTDGALQGVGYSQFTMTGGERCSAVEAFINPIRNDPRLHLVTRATVTKIMVAGGVATGVEYLHCGEAHQAHAQGETIITAGAYQTPKLLMLSGIGPAETLREHGLAVQQNLPGVGRNLQDHHYAVLAADAPAGGGFFGQDRGVKMLINAARYALFKDGPASVSGAESIGFIRLEDDDPDPTIKFYCLALMHPMVPKHLQSHGVSLLVNLLNPASRGTVSLRSSAPSASPRINLNWLTNERDCRVMVRGFRYARHVLSQAPLREVTRSERWPGVQVESDDEILEHVRRSLVSNHHPVGTCRMGKYWDRDAVVDRDLRVRGIDRLRVMDASMMPTLIRSAPNATVMAVAEKGVDLMMAERAK